MVSDARRAARDKLDDAVREWLAVAAQDEDAEDYGTPLMLGWVVVASYTSAELEDAEATATSYECPSGQPVPMSLGLATMGAQRWLPR